MVINRTRATLLPCLFSLMSMLLVANANAIEGYERDGDESELDGVRYGFRPIIVGGLTMGGDTVVTMNYTTGETNRVRGGGFIQVGAGVQWRSESIPFSIVFSANYHNDNSPAVDGHGDFERFPLEAVAYIHGFEDWRFGFGLRRSLSPLADVKKTSSPTFHQTLSYYDANGTIVEMGYAATPNLWMNLRYVQESYKPKTLKDVEQGTSFDVTGASPLDGSHFGLNFLYVF